MSTNNRISAFDETTGQQIKLGLNNLTATTNPVVGSDGTIDYEVGSKWINVTSGEIFECLSNATGAAVWKSTTDTGSASPIIKLAEIAAIDCTTEAQTALYTVPAATKTFVTEMIIELTTITGGTGNTKFPKINVGIGGSFNNIFSNTRISGLDATTEFYHFNTSGVSAKGVATDVISFDVDTASNSTAYDVTVHLFGYNK